MAKLQNELNYKVALKRIWELMKLKPNKGSIEGSELELLVNKVEIYEANQISSTKF